MSNTLARIGVDDKDVPVLIVGGSVVGLSAALFLSHHGIPCLMIERHPEISPEPRATGLDARTMELFRSVGVERALRVAAPTSIQNAGVLRVETLAGREIVWYTGDVNDGTSGISPVRGCTIGQDRLEPILRDWALQLGSDLRFSTELIRFEQDADGVTALVWDRTTHTRHAIRARYLLAADGNGSSIRDQLGVRTHGRGTLTYNMNILFRADLREALRGRHLSTCYVDNPRVQGTLVTDGDRWRLGVSYSPELGESPTSFTHRHCVELIRAATGMPNLEVEILSLYPWKADAWVAERYQQGRVVLAGDAVHACPPTGGFGASMGIADAHNLAWKLAFVLKGIAGPELLSTYEVERRRIAEFVVEQAVSLYVDRLAPKIRPQHVVPSIDFFTIVFGYCCYSAAVFSEGNEHGHPLVEDPRHPTGRHGTRAAHVVLECQGGRLSALDLFGKRYVLLIGVNGAAWHDAARCVGARLEIALDIYWIGSEKGPIDVEQRWLASYDITSSDAVLVRPDGFVAWRARVVTADPEFTLECVLRRLLFRSSMPSPTACARR